jgi:glycosyltransferase involved in cell wall biosynthesis
VQLVFAGHHERDYEVLARVVHAVLDRNARVRFVLVSKDERCLALARHFPGQVRRLSNLTDEDYRAVLQSSDLMVLPLRHSVAVTAVLEAMACGVPVVTTTGGVGDYVTADSGILCTPGNSDEMTEAACGLLADDTRLLRFKENARETAQRFAWPLVAKRTAAVYRFVAAQLN